jgi:hypothetical protein
MENKHYEGSRVRAKLLGKGFTKAQLCASGRLQQGQQAAPRIQRHQIIAPPHMGCTNENLRHCATTGGLHHVVALERVGVDAYFLDLLNALGFEDIFGARAIRANGGGVHLDGLHV